jgi:branched-chain amino acid transport system substrate-binding protein
LEVLLDRRIASILATALFGLSSACSRQPGQYLLGAVGPQAQAYGVQNQHGIELAVDEINRAGGINGTPLRLVTRDDHGDASDATRIAAQFVANPEIVAVIGHAGSSAEVSAAHVYDSGHLPAVATSATSPDITGISRWIFRMASSDSVNGATLARFANAIADSLHRPARVAVMYQNDAYGRGLADAFLHNFTGQVLTRDPFGTDTRLEPYVTYLATHSPDVVFVASDATVGTQLLHEARRQNLHASFLAGDGWQSVVADPSSDGAFIGTPFTAQNDTPAARKFTASYRARYGIVPDAHAALAYDATRMVAAALRSGATTRESIRNYLSSLTSTTAYPGLSGPVWFSGTDRVGDRFRVTRVRNGLMIPVAAQ